MPWTPHVSYNFHAENCDQSRARDIVNILRDTGYFVMATPYQGAWEYGVQDCAKFTWIAPHNEGPITQEAKASMIEHYICELTGNTCLMPTRHTVEVNCKCKE